MIRVASRPSTTGIRMSISTTSGRVRWHSSDAGPAVLGVAHHVDVGLGVIGAGGQGRPMRGPSSRRMTVRSSPSPTRREWRYLSQWYYTGKSGRGPVKAEIEKHYSARRQPQVHDVRRLPRHAREGKRDRCRPIATPDHFHAYISIIAMKSGKHVYCEKPLTHNIREARIVARVAKETKVATQMGKRRPLERGPSPDSRVD